MTKDLRETLPGKHLLPEVHEKLRRRRLAHVKTVHFKVYFKIE